MLEVLTLKQKAFGVDLSDTSLKIAQLEPARKGLRLASFSEVSLPKGAIVAGEIQKEDDVIAALKKAVRSARGKTLKTKYVVASLPEQKAFLQIVQLPRMAKEDVLAAVRFQAENYIPIL